MKLAPALLDAVVTAVAAAAVLVLAGTARGEGWRDAEQQPCPAEREAVTESRYEAGREKRIDLVCLSATAAPYLDTARGIVRRAGVRDAVVFVGVGFSHPLTCAACKGGWMDRDVGGQTSVEQVRAWAQREWPGRACFVFLIESAPAEGPGPK